MSLPFRLRLVLCAFSVGVLSGCGGGGDYSLSEARIASDQPVTPLTPDEVRAASVPPANQIYVLGGTSEVTPEAYELIIDGSSIEYLGTTPVGFIKMLSPVVELTVGHLKDDTQKFFVYAKVVGSQTLYECISTAWTAEEKDTMLSEFGSVPATCSEDIKFDGATNLVSMVRAQIPSPSGLKLKLNVNTTLPPIVFPAS